MEWGRNQWASTVGKRRAIENHSNELFLSLQSLIAEVECIQNENDERLRTLNSLLATGTSSSSESFFAQFKSFLDIMQLNGRSDEIDQDIERIFSAETPQELRSVTRKAAELESPRKMRIRILLEADDKKIPTCRELEQGFSSTPEASTPLKQYLNVISHLVFKVLGLSNDPIRPIAVAGDIREPADPILVLKLHRGGTLLGQIHIQPSVQANDKLVRLLTEYCHNNSVEAGRKIAKVSTSFRKKKKKN